MFHPYLRGLRIDVCDYEHYMKTHWILGRTLALITAYRTFRRIPGCHLHKQGILLHEYPEGRFRLTTPSLTPNGVGNLIVIHYMKTH